MSQSKSISVLFFNIVIVVQGTGENSVKKWNYFMSTHDINIINTRKGFWKKMDSMKSRDSLTITSEFSSVFYIIPSGQLLSTTDNR